MASGLENIETIESPFRRFVTTIGVFPTAFTDAMTYYECLAYLVKYLEETVIPAVNENAKALEELQVLYVQLKKYVDDYFDNLDVQEEINNKLDAMVEAGTLQEIITSYIQANVAWTFDTVAEMKTATNLVAGSYAQTLGFHSINDGGGALYKITDSGTADECAVISVGDLYANLIAENVMNTKQFGVVADGVEDDTTLLQKALDFCKGKVQTLEFIGTEIYTTNSIDLTTYSDITLNFATKIHRKSSASSNFGFKLTKCSNITFNNLNLYSERDQNETPPQDHTRVSPYGSNIIGIIMYACENMTFNNSSFLNTESDFFNQRYNSTDDLSDGITINKWYSRNSSGVLFMQFVHNVYINKADIIPAEDMGDGDHFLYFSNNVENVYVTESKFVNTDNHFGSAINWYNTGTLANNSTCPKNLFVDKCIFDIYERVISARFLSNAKITNCKIKYNGTTRCIYTENSANISLDNCDISGTYQYFLENASDATIEVKNCNIVNENVSPSAFMSFSGTTTPNIIIKNNNIKYDQGLLYSQPQTTLTLVFKDNVVNQANTGGTYGMSVRNGNCVVKVVGNIINNTVNKNNFVYNNNISMNSFYVFSNVVKGYTSLANSTDITTITNDYNHFETAS